MKKGLKKCLSIVLTIAMILSVMSVSFTANAEDIITVNDIRVVPGDEINYYFEIEDSRWFLNGDYRVTYDNRVLEFTAGEKNELYSVINDSGASIIFNVKDNGNGTSTILMNFTTLTGVSFAKMSKVFAYNFKVKSDAPAGASNIEMYVDATCVFTGEGRPSMGTVNVSNMLNIVVDGEVKAEKVNLVTDRIPGIDVSELEALIAEAEALVKESGYTADSLSALETAIAHAKTVAEFPETQQEVTDEIAALQAAMDGLKIDTAALEALIAQAKEIDTTGYTAATVEALNSAITAAETVAANPESVQAVKDAAAVLQAAMDGLVIDTAALEALIAQAKELDTEGYTQESIDALNNAIAAAETVAAAPESVQAVTEAIAALRAAIDGLAVDTTALEALIAQAKGLDTEGYTAATVEALNNAITAAEAVIKAPESVQAVKDAAAALRAAMDGLVIDTAELEALIAEAKDIDTDGLTAEYVERLEAAIATAEAVVKAPESVQQVRNATENLRATMDGAEIDTAELEALIAEANGLDTEGYTQASVNALKEEIAAAEAVAANPESVFQVKEAIRTLEAAMNGLVIDTAELEALIAEAKDIDTDGLTAEYVERLEAAIATAEAVVKAPESVQQVRNATENLRATMDGAEIDTAELEALIAEANGLDTEGYTQASVNALKEEIAAAEAVAANPESVEAVQEAIAALQAAMDGLKIDTSELEALIAEAEAINTEGYTTGTVNALKSAIAEAKNVVANPSSVQAVKNEIVRLQNVMSSLIPITKDLRAAIENAEKKLNMDIYSPKSKAALQEKADAGKELLNAIDNGERFVSYEEVVEATNAINDAIAALIEGVLLGDADGSNTVNVLDATQIQKFLADLISEDEIVRLAADANKDGKISILDATTVQIRLSLGEKDEYVFADEA